MNVLIAIVLIQIVVFQCVAVFLARSIPLILIGDRDLPRGLGQDMERFRRQAGRLRFVLGGALILALLAIGFVWPVGPGNGKLLIAAISLSSSVAMVVSYARDRRTIQSMRNRLPETQIRWASLERRTVWRYYRPAWEAVPIAIVVLSAAFTIWATPQITSVLSEDQNVQGVVFRLCGYLVFQGILIFGFLALVLGNELTSPNVVTRLPMFRDRPEAALAVDEALRGTELRYFMTARIWIALLLGFRQVEIAMGALGHRAAGWFDTGVWLLVAVLLGLFGIYIFRVVRICREMITRTEGQTAQSSG